MGGWEDGRMGGRERLNALGSGWFRFREWFVFCFGLDGLLEALVWSGLAGLVWSGWSGCTLVCRRSYYSFCFCLVVCSFRTVCCMLYTVLVLSCLCALFGIKLEMGDIELAS